VRGGDQTLFAGSAGQVSSAHKFEEMRYKLNTSRADGQKDDTAGDA
jgi:hypothetical protein